MPSKSQFPRLYQKYEYATYKTFGVFLSFYDLLKKKLPLSTHEMLIDFINKQDLLRTPLTQDSFQLLLNTPSSKVPEVEQVLMSCFLYLYFNAWAPTAGFLPVMLSDEVENSAFERFKAHLVGGTSARAVVEIVPPQTIRPLLPSTDWIVLKEELRNRFDARQVFDIFQDPREMSDEDSMFDMMDAMVRPLDLARDESSSGERDEHSDLDDTELSSSSGEAETLDDSFQSLDQESSIMRHKEETFQEFIAPIETETGDSSFQSVDEESSILHHKGGTFQEFVTPLVDYICGDGFDAMHLKLAQLKAFVKTDDIDPHAVERSFKKLPLEHPFISLLKGEMVLTPSIINASKVLLEQFKEQIFQWLRSEEDKIPPLLTTFKNAYSHGQVADWFTSTFMSLLMTRLRAVYNEEGTTPEEKLTYLTFCLHMTPALYLTTEELAERAVYMTNFKSEHIFKPYRELMTATGREESLSLLESLLAYEKTIEQTLNLQAQEEIINQKLRFYMAHSTSISEDPLLFSFYEVVPVPTITAYIQKMLVEAIRASIFEEMEQTVQPLICLKMKLATKGSNTPPPSPERKPAIPSGATSSTLLAASVSQLLPAANSLLSPQPHAATKRLML